MAQCSAVMPQIEQRCNGQSFGLASVRKWMSKEGRKEGRKKGLKEGCSTLVKEEEVRDGGEKRDNCDRQGQAALGGRPTEIETAIALQGKTIQFCQPHV